MEPVAAVELAKKILGEPGKLFIDGQWLESSSGDRFETINPATEACIVEVAKAGEREAELAVQAASRAFEQGPWSRMKPLERGNALFRLADVMERRAEGLSLGESLDTGKPLNIVRTRGGPFGIGVLRY